MKFWPNFKKYAGPVIVTLCNTGIPLSIYFLGEQLSNASLDIAFHDTYYVVIINYQLTTKHHNGFESSILYWHFVDKINALNFLN